MDMATVELQPAVLELLAKKAHLAGLSLEEYLTRLAKSQSPQDAAAGRLGGDELEELLDAEASTDSTYAGSYSRADIYRDHD